ncbi:response regulator [Paenibacillus sp. GCM10028914]|uniref:response regulator transcription factor n=1 Tax=Paenibacillus sp. GCM10028914 TaxID=3273416 RepID=UPI003606FEED
MYRLMIIDDEYMIHLSLRKLVETSGLEIEVTAEAEDGQEALELLESSSPDIIVTDIRMPEMDGLSFIHAAQQRKQGLRFIILSGYSHFEYAQQAIQYGVSHFLLKPVDPELFLQSLSLVYNELNNKEVRFIRQNDWLVKYQTLVNELTSHIWSADDGEALNALKRACQHYDNIEPGELSFPQFSSNLIRLLEEQLKARSFIWSKSKVDTSSWPNNQDACLSFLQDIITELVMEIKGSRNLGARHNILKATRFIEEHYAEEDLSLTKVADSLGMSVAYLSRSFKEEMNINFVKYLIKVRLDKAKSLLETDSCSATEAAYQVGFTDYSHFSRTFKKHFGLGPSEYRKWGG